MYYITMQQAQIEDIFEKNEKKNLNFKVGSNVHYILARLSFQLL